MQLRQETLLSVMVSGRSAQGLAGVRQGCGGRWAIRCLASTGPRCAWLLPQASWAGGARLVQRQGGKAEAIAKFKGGDPKSKEVHPLVCSSAPNSGSYTASAWPGCSGGGTASRLDKPMLLSYTPVWLLAA